MIRNLDNPTQSIGTASPATLRLARLSFLLLVVLLAWMKTPLTIGGLAAAPVDLIFLITFALWAIALIRRETALRAHRGFWLLGFYFAVMLLSASQSGEPQRTAIKLLSQVYLLALPMLAYNLIRTSDDLRQVFNWWVASAAAVTVVGVLTLLLFPILGRSWPLSLTLHNFGTLPRGAYPRLELTFLYPAMLVNYLTASLMLLLIGERLGWFDRRWAIPLAIALVVVAFFALTPGFGGLLFIVGAWLWYLNRQRYPWAARLALAAGCIMPIAGVLLASVTPIMHPTATFLIHLPGLPPLASSVRLLAWTEAVQNFLSSPVLGHGIGVQTVNVDYEASGCSVGCVTDAHNTFLNVAVQLGVAGLAALCAFVWSVSRRMAPRPASSPRDLLVFGLSAAWLSGFALQGLVGSFEDARHLWIVLGLIWAAESLTKPVAPGRNPTADSLAR